jgi:hypothetical protein
MCRLKLFCPVFIILFYLTLTACSNVQQIESASPEELRNKLEVIYEEDHPDSKIVRGPPINVRAGFGEFSKGLLLGGGANFGNSVYLQARQAREAEWLYEAVVSLQYTNLGGVYRHYDRAGIEGAPPLNLVTLDMDKQFTINSINMTETVSIAIPESFLKSKTNAGFSLVIADDSTHSEELLIPASYLKGFLLGVGQ